jgi:hypothetical protein
LWYQYNKISALYDDEMRETLFADEVRQFGRIERLRFLFAQPRLWIESALLVAAYLWLPLSKTWSVLGDFVLKGRTDFATKLQVLPLFLAVCVPLAMVARMNATEHWYWHQRGEQKLYDTKKRYKNPSQRAFDGAVIGTTFSALVVGGVAGIVIPAMVGYLPALLTLFTSRAALVAIILVAVWYLLRTCRRLRRRRRFLKRLRTVCKAEGYTIQTMERPYRSLFGLFDGENIRLCGAQHTYSIKFLSAKSRRNPLLLHENGVCEFLRIVRFARMEVSRFSRAYDVSWEADAYKVLLLDPVPYKVLNVRGEELDNGSLIGDYKIFTGTAFLNALERDCVEKTS